MNDIIINVGDVDPEKNIIDVKTLRESFVEPNINEVTCFTGQILRTELDQFVNLSVLMLTTWCNSSR